MSGGAPMNVLQRRTLVTGASHPIGVELVRQALQRGDQVFAACRNPARVPVLADLRAEFAGLTLLPLDPADPSSVTDVIPVLESFTDTLDLLVVGPAEPAAHDRVTDRARDEQLETLTATGLTEQLRRQAVAPLVLVRSLLPFLTHRDGARVLLVSSWLGSIANKTQGGDYATCASAAALHMLGRTLAHDLVDRKIVVCVGNPGAFATSPDGPLMRHSVEEAALGLLSQMDRLPAERSGAYLDWTGSERAW